MSRCTICRSSSMHRAPYVITKLLIDFIRAFNLQCMPVLYIGDVMLTSLIDALSYFNEFHEIINLKNLKE